MISRDIFRVVKIPQNHYRLPSGRQEWQSNTSVEYAKNSMRTVGSLSNGPVPMTQESNSLIFGRDRKGFSHISELRQDVREGALVLHTMRENGILTLETLIRLPKWAASENQAALLKPFRDDSADRVRIVLNRGAKPFQLYRSDELSDPILPAILERDQSTITTFVRRGTHSLEDGAVGRDMSRKLVEWDGERDQKRPRRE